MSFAAVQDNMLAHLRSLFARKVRTVELYAGQFNVDEIDFKAFVSPAVYLANLGWVPAKNKEAGAKVVNAKFAIFCVAKSSRDRNQRMLDAQSMAEIVSGSVMSYRPCEFYPTQFGKAENMYSRSLDKQSHAIFLVEYWQQVLLEAPAQTLHDFTDFDMTNNADDLTVETSALIPQQD